MRRLLPLPVLAALLGTGAAAAPPAAVPTLDDAAKVLESVILPVGISGAEAAVRDAVKALLPNDVESRVDESGNLLVTLGEGPFRIVVLAHLDEIGFEVREIQEDGRLALAGRGGFLPALFEAVPVRVFSAKGAVNGVICPRVGDVPPQDAKDLRVDVGTDDRAGTEALGVKTGDLATVVKTFDRLGPTRAMGRAMDDRVGCSAVLLALRHLDPARLAGATVTFAWVTREEVGLEGSAELATRMKADLAVAVDTFVSADTPREDRRFGYARLGEGCVARAADHSNLTPLDALGKLRALAARRGIPLQSGQTGGGNDASVWVPKGAVALPIGWPLRSSHSWVEVIDLRDLVSLARMVQAIAEEWR
ncbi:MAG: M28 family peptidase [Planctomycetales bacterium]|nr:M28 family peptidase [Planctomycetales bacterium]